MLQSLLDRLNESMADASHIMENPSITELAPVAIWKSPTCSRTSSHHNDKRRILPLFHGVSRKSKAPWRTGFVRGLFKGTQTFKRHVFIYPVELSNLFSSQPGFLIEPANCQEEGQEEHPEHEVGGCPEILVDPEADVEEH